MPNKTRRSFLSSSLLLAGLWGTQHRPELKSISGQLTDFLAPAEPPVPDRKEVSRIITQERYKPSRERRTIDPDHQSYAEFVRGLGLRYIEPWEILAPHKKVNKGVQNSLPPRELWEKMAPTLLVADEIRHRLGSPLRTINSAYRSPCYNRTCGGATRSYHMKNQALDLMFDASPAKVARVAKQLRKEGFFKGGVGTYRSFTHIDTRGHNATWRA